VKKIQGLVAKALEIAVKDQLNPANSALYFDADVACFTKLTSKENLHSQLVTFLLNRTLNILKQLVMHDIPVEPPVIELFNKIATNEGRMTDVFMLTKSRIVDLTKSIALQ
jgi:hypothetical protein